MIRALFLQGDTETILPPDQAAFRAHIAATSEAKQTVDIVLRKATS